MVVAANACSPGTGSPTYAKTNASRLCSATPSYEAIHGGKAKYDKIDAHKIAGLLRGGMLPQAYVYPAKMRATRDLLRRHMHLAHKRAELLAHVHNLNSQDDLPAIGKQIASKATRDGGAERCADPAVHKKLEVDPARLTSDDALLRTAFELDTCLQGGGAYKGRFFVSPCISGDS